MKLLYGLLLLFVGILLLCLEKLFFREILNWYPDFSSDLTYFELWSWGTLLVSLILAVLLWLWGSRNWLLAWFSIPVWYGTLLLFPLIALKTQQAELDAYYFDLLSQQRHQLRIQVARRNALEMKAFEDRMERAKTDRFALYEGRIPADELEQIRALDEELTQPLRAKSEEYGRMVRENRIKTIDDWLQSKDADFLRDQHERVLRYYEFLKSYVYAVEEFERTYDERVDALELSDAGRRVAVAERERLLQYIDKLYQRELLLLEIEFFSQCSQLLDSLVSNWGTWYWDFRDQELKADSEPFKQSVYSILRDTLLIQKEINRLIDELNGESEKASN